jgi:hypothetical protein
LYFTLWFPTRVAPIYRKIDPGEYCITLATSIVTGVCRNDTTSNETASCFRSRDDGYQVTLQLENFLVVNVQFLVMLYLSRVCAYTTEKREISIFVEAVLLYLV